MTPDEAIREAEAGKLRPVYLVLGEERVLVDRVLGAIRGAALRGGVAGFNEDKLTAGETNVDQVITTVRTAPMFAKLRFVWLRSVDRWDSQTGGDKPAASLDRLADYASSPVESACLVLTASKLDGRRRLSAVARKQGFVVSCDQVERRALPKYIQREARERGHTMDESVAELLAEIAGPDLGRVIDAIERLSLYVGKAQPIDEEAVCRCVTRVRTSTIWELVGAVGRRDAAAAMASLAQVYDPQDRGLPLLGVLAWSVRQLVRVAAALRRGASPDQAALQAGAQAYRGRDLAAQASKVSAEELERWLGVLAEADLALKGSRKPPRAVLEAAILTMTRGVPK